MSKKPKAIEAVLDIIDSKAFTNILSKETSESFKILVKKVHEEAYNKGFQDGGNICNQTFSRICDTLARN
jgi:hypothetical protein